MIGKISSWSRWPNIFRALGKSRRAAVLVEMAFSLPLLLFLGLGGIELVNLAITHTRISQIALGAADNAARIAFGSGLSLPRVREVDINEVFTGVDRQSDGMEFQRRGRIILSSLETNSDGGQKVAWQRCHGNLAAFSSYGKQGDGTTGTSFKGMGPAGRQVQAIGGSPVMFVEIFYDYEPIVYSAVIGSRRIRTTAAFNVREGRDLTKVYNNEPVVSVATCPVS